MSSIPKIHAGSLTTYNQDTYPGLDAWFVQLWDGSGEDAMVVMRVYGGTPEQARERADLIVKALNSYDYK